METKLNYSLRELAQLAGVSKSTASRVISGNGYASPDVRERVLKAAEKLHYRPSAVARAMVAKRTHNIGVIVFRDKLPIVSHTLYGKIIDEILMAAEGLGYSIFLKTDREMSFRSMDYMLEQRVDGLILVSRLRKNVIDYVKKFNIPYVMVNGSTEDPDVVHLVSNDEVGGERAAEHLYACGHRRFWINAGPGEHRSHSLRLSGFCRRLEQLGIPCGAEPDQEPDDSIRNGKDSVRNDEGYVRIAKSPESSFDFGRKLMEKHYEEFRRGGYSALFSTNDMLALGAMKVLLEHGVSVPEEVAVMGYDNTDPARMYHPSLTTVSVDAAGIGRDAVAILDKLIGGEEGVPRLIEYESEVIVRQSTKCKEDMQE
ncbi:LacI family DNA-binding transcriptional regulator [Saccharibacillus kuerlensis]|uniref:LacI family transcriptional regulator n=1 Tax=Saccharibacillus kuerlensis TaxID=459527 RepID=A0ABQ2L4U6_9BACL|nr:LacI family DNA-binding transcriptional regulator [Saccharibacillus kuerlensis]GGO03441.1 LacI family transcriptional regulator [Saccharibacillus kuerlensis]